MYNNERKIIQVKKSGEIEFIKSELIQIEDVDLNELSCLGCSWKGTITDLIQYNKKNKE